MTPGKKNVGTNFPKPLFQSEEAIYMKIIFLILMQIELTFTTKVLHLASF